MLLNRLLAVVNAHLVWNHGVFARLSGRELPQDSLATYLREMGAFCAASRSAGGVVEMLVCAGLPEQARLANEIFLSESGHGEGFADMVC